MVPDWAKALPWPIIREKAREYRLSPELVAACIQTESAGNTYAIRYEMKFSTSRVVGEIFDYSKLMGATTPTLEMIYKTSYGLMQVMGAVFYEHGGIKDPRSKWATSMVEPEIGIDYGCKHLRLKADTWGSDPATLIAAYNAGIPRRERSGFFRNQRHVDRFMRYYREIRV